MGTKTAMEIGETMRDELTLLRGVIWHLQGNLYPPFPATFADACVQAIKSGWDEEWDKEIELPDGRIGTAQQIIEFFRLEWYMNVELESEDY